MFAKESLHGVGVGRPYGAAFLALESLTALARALAKRGSDADAPAAGPKPAIA
jgi:hypothetical protein